MPAALETGFFGNSERAWHGLGTVIPEDVVDTERALTLAGLDWEVEKVPMFVDGQTGYETVENYHATQRSSDGRVLGVVGDYYRPVQNREGFAFGDGLIGEGAKWHTAGSLEGGKCVWMLARLPLDLKVAGEPHVPFLFLTNRHDGKGAVKVACTPVRVVCANTLAMAVRGAKRTWSARHLGQWDNASVMIDEARQTLGFATDYFTAMADQAEQLAAAKMTERQFVKQVLDHLIPLQEATGDVELRRSDRAARNAEEARSAILGLFTGAPNLENVRGTKWAAYNAVAEYAEWYRPVRATRIGDAAEQRFSRTLVGDPQGGLADKALALLAA